MVIIGARALLLAACKAQRLALYRAGLTENQNWRVAWATFSMRLRKVWVFSDAD